MKQIIALLFLLLSSAIQVSAQSTTLSGQVTDSPDSQSWNNGTFTLQFVPNPQYQNNTYTWTGGTLNQTITGTLNGTGSYSVSVPSNSSITPVGSQWQMTVCPQATSPCFISAKTTVTGGTQTLNLTPPSIRINLPSTSPVSAYADTEISGQTIGSQYYNVTSQAVRIWNGSAWTAAGGGTTIVTSNPATCTPPATFFNTTSGQTFVCTATNTLTAINGSGAISPLSFSAKGDWKLVGDAQWSNTSSNVTCPASDCNFLFTDVGKMVFGTTCTAQINLNMLSSCGVLIPLGTISSMISANSINVSTTSTAACTASSAVTCFIAWGTQDEATPIQNASNAAFNTPNGPCALDLGVGIYAVSAGEFNGPQNNRCFGGASGATSIADLVSVGPVVMGKDRASSIIIPLPTFNFACTGGAAANVCFGGMGNLHMHDFSIFGLGQPVGGTQNVVLVSSQGTAGGGNCDGGTTMWNMAFSSWAWNTTGTTGLQLANNSCNDPVYWNINISAFGSQTLNISQGSANITSLNGIMAWGGTNYTLILNTPGTVNSVGSQYHGPLSTNFGVIQCGGTQTGKFVSRGDAFTYVNGTVAGETAINCNSGSQFFDFESATFALASGTSSGTVFNTSAGSNTVHFKNSKFTFAGANNRFAITAVGDQLFDDGGNSFGTLGGTASIFNAPIAVTSNSGTFPISVASRNTALGSTTLMTALPYPVPASVNIYAYDSAAGTSCTGNTTVTWTVSYTDPTGTAQTSTATETITTNGGATGGDALKVSLPIQVGVGQTVAVSTTYSAGTGCATNPSYAALVRLI